MKMLRLLTVFISLVWIGSTQSVIGCVQYLNQMRNLYNTSRAEFNKEMAPYLILSGKILDDMGFPISCLKMPANAFWEVELNVQEISTKKQLTMYYGLCFTGKCNAQTLNQQSDFLIEALFKNVTDPEYQVTAIQFNSVNMEVSVSPGSVAVCVIISLFILARMVSSFKKWGQYCVADTEEEVMRIELAENQNDKDAGRMPEYSLSFLDRFSLERALGNTFVKQDRTQIVAFSYFKIISIPFLTLGYLFYLSNYGAYNYFSFNHEIYTTFYSKIATFAYYLPDIFFFISGFLFSRKLIRQDQISQSKQINVFAAFFRKLIKLYPIYFVVLIVYWFVTPSLHSGPLWNVYKEQVSQCNSSWWRSIIMIDNWFADGCFNFSWYVQAQVQFSLITSFIFIVYGKRRTFAYILIYGFLITSFIFVCVFSQQLPSSIQSAISQEAILFFQAFYSHWFFYMVGVELAFLFEKQSVKSFIRTYYTEKTPVLISAILAGFTIIITILLRPKLWQNGLGAQLVCCRMGVMISFLIFCLPNMANEEVSNTYIHKITKLTYPIILWMGLVTNCGFWGLDTFAYVDALNLIQASISYVLISLAVGLPVGVAFDFSPFALSK